MFVSSINRDLPESFGNFENFRNCKAVWSA
jgi:hypothetical protein